MPRLLYVLGLWVVVFTAACHRVRQVSQDGATLAELRSVKGELKVTPPGERARAPYRRERLMQGERVTVPEGGLAWMRRDGGATWLVSGPAEFVVEKASVELSRGRAFVDSERGDPVSIRTPVGEFELADARASVSVAPSGETQTYVLRGTARAGNAGRANAGELLTLSANGKFQREAAISWEDWTGGFATAEPTPEPAPFGIGTVGARKPGDQGKPRTSLVIQRLEVKVTIEQDFAVTEVDETFVNPTSDEVEGIFSFRTPRGALLERFGVDRDGDLVWGRVKESVAAALQYQQNVYQGSEEDPALLELTAPGVYQARLYPIGPGKSRRVVTRYTEWLSRQGPRAERRLYVYPMAAEGAKASLPRIEEFTAVFELGRAGAKTVRAGMGATREGQRLVVKAFDFVPRADLAVELFDEGQAGAIAYRARHLLSERDVSESAPKDFAREVAQSESDYLAIPLRAPSATIERSKGVDLALVIDASAATEPSALSLARVIAGSLLLHLGPEDRAALWTGDASLRPVAEGSGALGTVTRETRKRWLAGLSAVERGGATDIGALLTEAASKLDPERRGAVIYVGDGVPSVGELVPKALRERLTRLSPRTRVLVAAVGSQPNLPLLDTLARGAPVERVDDAYSAAGAALRLLEAAARPTWLAARLELGPGIERVLPRELPPVASDETVIVVGRVSGKLPTELVLHSGGAKSRERLSVRWLDDLGDLRRRWGNERLSELAAEGAGRASLVETARRFGLVSSFTSLYVPTKREAERDGDEVAENAEDVALRRLRWKPWARGGALSEKSPRPLSAQAPAEMMEPALASGDKEGGTGTRAKGEAADGEAPLVALSRRGGGGASLGKMWRDAAGDMQKPMKAEPAPPLPVQPPPAIPTATAVAVPKAAASPAHESADNPVRGPAPASAERPKPVTSRSAGALSAASPNRESFRPGAVAGVKGHGRAEPRWDENVPVQSEEEPVRPVLGAIAHEPSPCGAAAELPLADRLLLWRERLVVADDADRALHVYTQALRGCEASDWRERSALLVAMVDRLPRVRDRVALWKLLLGLSPRAADAVYRFLLLRVQTSVDLKEFHEALGLSRIEPELLASFLEKAKTPRERLASLRGAAERFDDDTELALLVLEAYEDAGDQAGGRAWARKLRRRVDATAHVRTNVGEYYLRLAAAETGRDKQRDSDEALRTFGELVEFAPEDPLTRRLLGDLLRSHGWHEEALRQYQTLAGLTPDDPSVPLLLALAAEGTGKIEEAVRWAEKAAQSGAPDGASPVPVAARALTSAFLGWARQDSARAGKTDEAERLRKRAQRLAASAAERGVRVILSWSHPELRPALWTDKLGAMLPADDNLPLLGVGQAFVPASPVPRVEVRLDPEDAARAARLGAVARLTVIENEGSAGERIAQLDLRFRAADGSARSRVPFRFENGALIEEAP